MEENNYKEQISDLSKKHHKIVKTMFLFEQDLHREIKSLKKEIEDIRNETMLAIVVISSLMFIAHHFLQH